MPETLTLRKQITQHLNDAMALALSSERYPLWKRDCPELKDVDFIELGLLRCISIVDSGRHFLQTADELYGEQRPLSTYFNSLKSSRRTNMLEAVEQQSYKIHCETLQSQGVDYLKEFSELAEYTVEAADGHFINHACHTKKGANGKVYAAGFIYALNLRYGLLRPLCHITNGTIRHHEIPALRTQLEKQNKKKKPLKKHLYIYDKAVTDYAWWDNQKQYGNYMISVLKENSVASFVSAISFDSSNEINTGIEQYSRYENKGVQFTVVDYRDPETKKLHRFITTLNESMSPGIIALLYFKRWTIEKAFNNSKSNLKETKAWSGEVNSLKNQMRLTAMSYNLTRVYEESSKIKQPGFMHPSDIKYTKALEKRQQVAKKKGCFVNALFFQVRIARVSSRTIRGVQNAIITGKSVVSFMNDLVAQLVPITGGKLEH
jgi:hypothetical protein